MSSVTIGEPVASGDSMGDGDTNSGGVAVSGMVGLVVGVAVFLGVVSVQPASTRQSTNTAVRIIKKRALMIAVPPHSLGNFHRKRCVYFITINEQKRLFTV
jgi:hypothetical protein